MLRKMSVMLMVILGLGIFAKNGACLEVINNFFDKLNLGYEDGAIIGLGVRYATQPYIDVDDWVFPVPVVNVQYKNFFWEGTTFGYYVNKNEKYKIALLGAPRFWGYEPDDSAALTGMSERSWSLDGGVRASWVHNLCTAELTLLTDLSGEHHGQEVNAFLKHEFLSGALTPRVGVRWLSDNLVDHYFGVNGGEQRPGRPAYQADNTVNYAVGAILALPIGERWAWVTDGIVTFLGDEIKDSPIVEDDVMATIVTGLVYRY